MIRTEIDKGYVLTADPGKDLVVLAKDGTIQARTKEVFIPGGQTKNIWTEADEATAEATTADETQNTQEKILELEKQRYELDTQILALKTQTTA